MSPTPPPPGPPPPPPPSPPPPPGTGPAAYRVGDALAFGWSRFQTNLGPILVSALVLLLGVGVVLALGWAATGALTGDAECRFTEDGELVCEGGTGFVTGMVVQAVLTAVLMIVFQVIAAGMIRAALTVTDGGRWELADVVRTDRLDKVVGAALLVAGATFVGTLLCYLPGLVAGFVLSYTMYFVIDRDLGPVDAARASLDLVRAHLGPTLLWYVVGVLVASLGLLACGVGALVSLPVVLLGTAYTYRTLSGGAVAA